jgi:hypothetical protein
MLYLSDLANVIIMPEFPSEANGRQEMFPTWNLSVQFSKITVVLNGYIRQVGSCEHRMSLVG